MSKAELIHTVAQKTGLSEAAARKAVTALFESIQDELAKGEDVVIPGFGSFVIKERSVTQGFNPRTREPITYPARKIVSFKASSVLKQIVKG